MPCIMIQGTASGSGKSTIVTALCRILSDMGYDVAPFKSQNMSRYVSSGISRAQAVQAVAARLRPSHHMNPILLVPSSDRTSEVFEMGISQGVMDTSTYYKYAAERGAQTALKSLDTLRHEHDILVMEGAGSPAEINVPFDMANMYMAEAASASVIITADIERGGCFAHMVGTLNLLRSNHQDLVRGFIINKFRGEPSILESGTAFISETTGRPVLGIIPYMKTQLPPEDSLDESKKPAATGQDDTVQVMNSPDLEDAIDRTASMVQSALDMRRILRMLE